jgi:hypothetical protein
VEAAEVAGVVGIAWVVSWIASPVSSVVMFGDWSTSDWAAWLDLIFDR